MQSTVKLRAGLVGAGYISEYHVKALARLKAKGVELVGLCDVDATRANEAAKKFGTRAFTSLAELRQAGANVIHVLTPPHTHAAITLAALELGCHVLVEKPLATDEADCERIERKARETGLSVCVNHSLMYDPQLLAALSMARAGKVGQIVSVDILRSSLYPPFAGGPLPPQYRTAGYPFRDLGVHALYIFEAFLGPIQHVSGEWSSKGGDANLAYDEWRSVVRCRDGMGQFQLSWNVKPLQHQIIVQGTKGVIRADLFSMFHTNRSSTPIPKAIERVLNACGESVQTLVQVPWNALGFVLGRVRQYHGLQDLVAAFYDSLARGAESPVPVSQATHVVDWTERVARLADEDHLKRVALLTVPTNAKILVTGASGALGTAVVERLRAQGKRVRIMVRRLPETLPPPDIEVVLGDLGEAGAVDRAVKGIETVIHVGAAMKGGGPDHQRGTVEGTQHVLAACKTYGIKKLVHISSLSVVHWAGGRKNQPVDENSALEPHADLRGYYTQAKLEAERLVAQACKEGVPAVILRPGQIFGGRIPLMTPAVARKMGKRWLILGNGRMRLPLVYIDNVVDSIIAAADSDLKEGQVIQIVDDECPTQNEVLKKMFDGKARAIRLPRLFVFTLGKFSEFVFALLKRQSPFSLYRLRSALARRTFTNTRANELLKWRPRVGLDEAIARVKGKTKKQEAAAPAASAHPQGLNGDAKHVNGVVVAIVESAG